MKSRKLAILLSAPLLHSASGLADSIVDLPRPECVTALAVVKDAEIVLPETNSSLETEKIADGRQALFQMLMVDQSYFLKKTFIAEFIDQFHRPELRGRNFRSLTDDEQSKFVKRMVETVPPPTYLKVKREDSILRQGLNGIYYEKEMFPAIHDRACQARFQSLAEKYLPEVVRDFLLQQEDFYWMAQSYFSYSGESVGLATGMGTVLMGGIGSAAAFAAGFHGLIIAPITIGIPLVAGIVHHWRHRRNIVRPLTATLAGYQRSAQLALSAPSKGLRPTETLRLAPVKGELMQGRSSLVTVEAIQEMIPEFDAAKPSTVIDFGGDIERAIHTFSNAFNLRIFGRPSTSAFQSLRFALTDALDKTTRKDKTVTAISNRIGVPLEDLQKQTKIELDENIYFQEVHEVLTSQLKVYQTYLATAEQAAEGSGAERLMSLLKAKQLELAEFANGLSMVGVGLKSEQDQIIAIRQVTTETMNFMIQRLSNSASNKIEEGDLAKLQRLQAAFVKL